MNWVKLTYGKYNRCEIVYNYKVPIGKRYDEAYETVKRGGVFVDERYEVIGRGFIIDLEYKNDSVNKQSRDYYDYILNKYNQENRKIKLKSLIK